jgi:toxin-antitoxin system PIN domain toxin
LKPFLLDTNVLIALAWPNHVHHEQALDWFRRKGRAGFRTCPITQTGFVRISSNPSFTPHAVSPKEALALLARITRLSGHDFWPDDLSLEPAFGLHPPVVSHRQVTDGYLLALAIEHGGVLATLDRGVASLAGDSGAVEALFDN